MGDWQKTLSMVINRTIMNIDTPIDVASQEAMGDYSKPRDSSSDSDLRNCNDALYDEYSLSWTHNPYRPYSYNYEVNKLRLSRVDLRSESHILFNNLNNFLTTF